MPDRTKSSANLSRLAESDAVASHSGIRSASRPPHAGAESDPSRDATQFKLPWSVLISPLCPSTRIGCARGQRGVVLVEKRRW